MNQSNKPSPEAEALMAIATSIERFTAVYAAIHMSEEAEEVESPTYLDGTLK